MFSDSSSVDLLIEKLHSLNEQRLERARHVLSPMGLEVFELIPALLHFNHPELPGYLSSQCPFGIQNYQPDATALKHLKTWSKFKAKAHSQSAILGVYCMGSTASLGQCCASDLDIWVIYDSGLNAQQRNQLEQKCDQITRWAHQQGVEANFFLVDPEQFVHSRQQGMSKENCGSSQNWLLLDEFYRSCTRLAGCHLAWFLVPVEHEERYTEYVAGLFSQDFIDPTQWIDLGGIARVPAEEYFGAALWQLYKGIDSPFKAVLKTLLLECYAQEYPHTRLLCHDYKERWMQGASDPLALDSYALVLDRVTRYLNRSNDSARLDLARRCFYLKTCIRLSRSEQGHASWQRMLLKPLVESWEWPLAKLQELDRRDDWKVEQVRVTYKELLEALMESFRKLIEFARRNEISEAINPEDIGVLSRKLYASFEMTASKVELINPKIAPCLFEPVVTLVQVPEGRKIPPGWYLYKQPLSPETMKGAKAQKHCDHLSKLLAWAYFNGIVNERTELHLHSPNDQVTAEVAHRMIRDLVATIPMKFPKTRKEELIKPSEIRQLVLFVNLSRPLKNEPPLEKIIAAQDVFSIGEPPVNLVQSIDMLYLSNWNELHSFHFKGNEAILDCMLFLTSKMHKQASIPIRTDVLGYTNSLDHVIGQQIRRVLLDCMTLRLDRTNSSSAYRLLTLAGQKYGLFFERRAVYKHKLENPVDFYRHLSHGKNNNLSVFDRPSDHVDTPAIVDNHASEGLVQFFFERCQGCYNIYVVDEENQVELYEQFSGSKEELVQSVNRFYSSNSQNNEKANNGQVVNFNLPQFYEIVDSNGSKQILPYSSSETSEQSVSL